MSNIKMRITLLFNGERRVTDVKESDPDYTPPTDSEIDEDEERFEHLMELYERMKVCEDLRMKIELRREIKALESVV